MASDIAKADAFHAELDAAIDAFGADMKACYAKHMPVITEIAERVEQSDISLISKEVIGRKIVAKLDAMAEEIGQ